MKPAENLTVLEATIRDHARQIAAKEWEQIHGVNLDEVLMAAGLGLQAKAHTQLYSGIIDADGVKVGAEVLRTAIRERFLDKRQAELIRGISDQVVSEAFRKIQDE